MNKIARVAVILFLIVGTFSTFGQRPECVDLWDELFECASDPECDWESMEYITFDLYDFGCI